MKRTEDVGAQPQAGGGLNALARMDKHAALELGEALRSGIHLRETAGDDGQAASRADGARQRLAAEITKFDPAGVRTLAFSIGAGLVAVLAALDVVPLNWAAQAFGLAAAGTWLITGILLTASLAAMLGFEFTRTHHRKRLVLVGVVALAYVGLFLLRMQFLMTVAGEAPPTALLQAALLTAVSAALVLCGSAVMARTQHYRIARAKAEVRQTEQVAENAAIIHSLARTRLRRHVAVLRLRVSTTTAPAGTDSVTWAATLEREIQALFPEQ
jgi:hypothetical protein